MHMTTAVSSRLPFLLRGSVRLIAENEPILESPYTLVRVYAVILYLKVQCLLALYFAAIVGIVVVAAAGDDKARVLATLHNPREGCKAMPGHDLVTMVPV